MNTMSGRTTSRSHPTRIGQVRPSHLVTTTGVGAVVDLPGMSVIVRGTGTWSAEHQRLVHEPRLLNEVQRVLGDGVRSLKSAPYDASEVDDPWTKMGVPVTPFPGWVRCPVCHRLGPIHGSQQFTLVHRFGKRPDLAKIVHSYCHLQSNSADARKRRCIPARFMVVCPKGHLDDFPYNEYVHQNSDKPCSGPRLTMQDSAGTLAPQVTMKCECGAKRNIAQATGNEGSSNLPVCRGRHPHLQTFEGCTNRLRLIVLGASNLWFSVTASALHLPGGDDAAQVIDDNWAVVKDVPTVDLLRVLVENLDALKGLRDQPVEAIWELVQRRKAEGGPSGEQETTDLLAEEWALLSRPTTEKQDDDFRAIPNSVAPSRFEGLIDQVVRVTRLREVQALVGFTRMDAPEARDLGPRNLVRLRDGGIDWVPAVEKRGEGIFLQLREEAVAAWEKRVAEHVHIDRLAQAHRQWRRLRDLPPDAAFPVARTLLLHTLSHLLIRQVALECGYSSASIRERLYLGQPSDRTAGVLLSTAASDSEGTLGGLVSLGEHRNISRLLQQAIDEAERCSSDPLCCEHLPTPEDRTQHAAACHACLFISETSCEMNNRWLDRAVLVDVTRDGLAFLGG